MPGSCLRNDPVFDDASFCGLMSLSSSLGCRWAEGKGEGVGGEWERWGGTTSVLPPVGAGMQYGAKGEPKGAVMDW